MRGKQLEMNELFLFQSLIFHVKIKGELNKQHRRWKWSLSVCLSAERLRENQSWDGEADPYKARRWG